MNNNTLKVAKKYFDLANKGDLKEIEQMFTDRSTYSSQNTGVFFGTKQIMVMMKPFFNSFKTLRWDINNVKEVSEGIVLFDFTLIGEKTSGEKISIEGLEYIIVYENKIQHIDVRNK